MISIGCEPGYPVAAVDRGKRVIVARNRDFLVADHDFTRFSLVPSVSFSIDIPEEISESWYQGQVGVTLKEASMQPSSPLRHAAELVKRSILMSHPLSFSSQMVDRTTESRTCLYN